LLLITACSSGPPPGVHVLDAGEIGTLTQSSLIVGRDGAQSGLAFGHEVWTFGDTFLSLDNAAGYNFVSNTFATSDVQLSDGGLVLADRLDDAGAPDELLQPTADEAAYDLAHKSFADGGCAEMPCGGRWATWPGAPVFEPDSGTAVIFYGLISAAPGDFNFHGVGQGLAVWTDYASLPERPEPNVCPGFPTLLFCQDEPGFGEAAVILDGDLYAFACERSSLSFPCQLGRVPFSQALTRSAWQFWDGTAWTADLSAAQPLFDGAPIMGVFFDDHFQLWMALYAEPLSNQVVLRTAPAITGPWSSELGLFVADRKGQGGNSYDALPHPELSGNDGQTLYVTFSRSTGTTFGSEFALVQVVLQ
jgi:hypothetical protein